MKFRALIFSILLLTSTFFIFSFDDVTVIIARAEQPMMINNTTYTISSDLTLTDRDLIIENSTVYLYGNIIVYEHNITIRNSTLLWNPSHNNQYALKCYNRYLNLHTIVHIENSTLKSNNTYRFYGIWVDGRYLSLNITNTSMDYFYSVTTYTIDNLYIDTFDSGSVGDRYIIISHPNFQRAVFGEALIRNTKTYRMSFSLDGLSVVTLENSRTTYFIVNDWGTVIARNFTFTSLSQQKGQTHVYQYMTVHAYDLSGRETDAILTVIDGDGNHTLYVQDGSGAAFVHTYNFYENNDVRYLNLTIGDNETQFRIIPEYNIGYFEVTLYLNPNGTIYNISVTRNMASQNTNNTTGAVSITVEPPNDILRFFSNIAKFLLATNVLILLGVGVLIWALVIHRRKRG